MAATVHNPSIPERTALDPALAGQRYLCNNVEVQPDGSQLLIERSSFVRGTYRVTDYAPAAGAGCPHPGQPAQAGEVAKGRRRDGRYSGISKNVEDVLWLLNPTAAHRVFTMFREEPEGSGRLDLILSNPHGDRVDFKADSQDAKRIEHLAVWSKLHVEWTDPGSGEGRFITK